MTVWLALLLAIGILSSMWAYLHRPTWLSVVAWPVLFMLVYVAGIETVGMPKPISLEWRDTESVEVEAWLIREGETIWLWVKMGNRPVSYSMPWTDERAKQLHGAQQKAEASGGKVMAKIFGDRSLEDRETLFYNQPVPPLPPKQ